MHERGCADRDVPNSRFIGKNYRMGRFGVGIGTLRQHFDQCRLRLSGDSNSFYPISGITIQMPTSNVWEGNFLSLKTRRGGRRPENFYDQNSSRLLECRVPERCDYCNVNSIKDYYVRMHARKL